LGLALREEFGHDPRPAEPLRRDRCSMGPAPDGITQLIEQMQDGDSDAEAALFEFLQSDLHGLAQRYMARQRGSHTLQATALLNEAWLRVARGSTVRYETRGHFLAVCARAMRSVLVDHARRRQALRRGGGASRQSLDALLVDYESRAIDVLDLDAKLSELKARDETAARIIEIRFFGGATVAETAEVLGIPKRTVEREWAMARAWLRRELS